MYTNIKKYLKVFKNSYLLVSKNNVYATFKKYKKI